MRIFFLLSLFLCCRFSGHARSFTDTAYNFTATTSQGKIMSLADYKGKFVLLDFWASWCRPCRSMSSKLKKLYNEFHPQGLEFIGIANEVNTDIQWKEAIEKDGIDSWAQIWDNNILPKYGVMSLPTLILIDPAGRIIQRFGGANIPRNKLRSYLKKAIGSSRLLKE